MKKIKNTKVKKKVYIKGHLRNNLRNETLRALKFYIGRIRKGITPQDAYTHTKSSYGGAVAYQVLVALKRNI